MSNVEFYAANAEDLSWLESESFDFINYAYVVHEMPAMNALNIINEMYRLLRPGGTMNGFEVPFFDSQIEREIGVLFNTWGYNWQVRGTTSIKLTSYPCSSQDSDGPQGPEPYMQEYEFGTLITESLAQVGFSNVEQIEFTYFDSVYIATK